MSKFKRDSVWLAGDNTAWRILCANGEGDYPIIGAPADERTASEFLYRAWRQDGTTRALYTDDGGIQQHPEWDLISERESN